jgi:hypothetical protein
MFVIFAVGTVTWFCYGWFLRDITIMVSFGLGAIGSWTILFLSFWYRKAR